MMDYRIDLLPKSLIENETLKKALQEEDWETIAKIMLNEYVILLQNFNWLYRERQDVEEKVNEFMENMKKTLRKYQKQMESLPEHLKPNASWIQYFEDEGNK